VACFRYNFTNEALLILALTHASVGEDNNKRLQFLGRPVLELLVREHLYLYGDEAAHTPEVRSWLDFLSRRICMSLPVRVSEEAPAALKGPQNIVFRLPFRSYDASEHKRRPTSSTMFDQSYTKSA
jgi:hypothetical protein